MSLQEAPAYIGGDHPPTPLKKLNLLGVFKFARTPTIAFISDYRGLPKDP